MKKEIKIEVPNDYSAITLRKYLELLSDLKTYEDDEEAKEAAMFWHLCGIDAYTLQNIDKSLLDKIKEQLYSFLNKTDYPLHRTVKIGEVEYGFEPNLSQMSYGAYIDISKYNSVSIDENWAKIMSILYRPVKRKSMGTYEIEEYTGKDNEALFLEVPMDVHYGALFFFVRLLTALPSVILKSMMDSEKLPQSIKSVLERSGKITAQLSN